MEERPIRKLYYSISEVSKLTSLKPYVLRYWETEFSELHPPKNKGGSRLYRLNDIKLIFLIKKLLYDDKYTIEGARQQLKKRELKSEQMKLSLNELQKNDLLRELRQELLGIKGILDLASESDNHQETKDLE
jgi:DNA-binding transcriptional MerR regulator